jgi:replicative DNA helicase
MSSPRRNIAPSFDTNMGKLPPQAVELEETVLGAILIEREAIDVVADILTADSFYKEAHGRVYNAARSLHLRSEPIDILTVTQELKRSGELELVGGAYYISQLTNRVASAANVEFHARIIAQKYMARELIRISSETIRDAYDDTTDVIKLTDTSVDLFMSLREQSIRSGREAKSIGQYADESVKLYQTRASRPDGLTGTTTGLKVLDLVLNGWQPSDLVIVAARPGMGKTALVLGAAKAAAESGSPVGFLSLEMPGWQLSDRLIIEISGVDPKLYKKGRLGNGEMEAVKAAAALLASVRMYIDDTPSMSITEIRVRVRRMIKKYGIKMLVVDYLQLAQGDENKKQYGSGNREQEIASITRGLKGIAKEFNMPVIALSQLSREVEKRGGDKRPQLSDLRESGSLEQDADIVIFIHRPEYYGFMTDPQGNSTIGKAELMIMKHRNGDVGIVDVAFDAEKTRFRDLTLPPPTGTAARNYTEREDESDFAF